MGLVAPKLPVTDQTNPSPADEVIALEGTVMEIRYWQGICLSVVQTGAYQLVGSDEIACGRNPDWRGQVGWLC
jgi:hypothetical protein